MDGHPNSLWRLQGASPGPRVCILGGTHGDELTGISVVRYLLERLGQLQRPAGTYACAGLRGELWIGFGNLEAIVRGTRGVSAVDLNRQFVTANVQADANGAYAPLAQNEAPSADLERARVLAPVLAAVDYCFDVHSVSSDAPGNEPFVCFGNDTDRLRALYRLIPVHRILTDPDHVLGRDVGSSGGLTTTDEWVNAHGGVGLCYETGFQQDLTKVPDTLRVLARLLVEIGCATEEFLERIAVVPAPVFRREQVIYKLAHCASLPALVRERRAASVFRYTHDRMAHHWHAVRAGEVIGEWAVHGAPADVRIPVVSPVDGCIVFPQAVGRLDPLHSAVTNACYIAQEIDRT